MGRFTCCVIYSDWICACKGAIEKVRIDCIEPAWALIFSIRKEREQMKKLWNKIKNLAKKFWMKVEDACIWIVKMVKKAIEWCMNNQETFYVGLFAASCISSGIKKYRKTKVEREMEFHRNNIYDRRMGHYWQLRRRLMPNEMLELEDRMNDGERMGDILESMRVLA